MRRALSTDLLFVVQPLLFRVVGGGEVVVGHEVLLLVGLVLGVRGPEAVAVGRVPRDARPVPAGRKDKHI